MTVIRTMTDADLPAAADISARAFGVDMSTPEGRANWRDRVAHTLISDPGGALVADLGGEIVGVAEAMVRERLWVLSLLTVDPQRQSDGAGRALLDAALEYGGSQEAGPLAKLIVSSDDPRALRLYGRAGFRLLPTFEAAGTPDTARLGEDRDPAIIEVGVDAVEDLAELVRGVRGAPWTEELRYALRRGATVLALPERGVIVSTSGRIWALAARDGDAAARLLRRGLAHASGAGTGAGAGGAPASDPVPVVVRWVTGEQQWAIETVLELGMKLRASGALCVQGDPGTLNPFLPSGPFA